jgi:hypothetical protein
MNITLEKLKKETDGVDWSKCSVGDYSGNGLWIGYEGWGNPHVCLNPADPLDAQLDQNGLVGLFDEVRCYGLLHRLHGDCTLTHAISGLTKLLKPGGVLFTSHLSLADVLRIAIEQLDRRSFVTSQTLEKMCFLPSIGKSGILFPQSMISKEKLEALFYEVGLSRVEITKDITEIKLPLFPDSVVLGDVPNEVWEASVANFTKEEGLSEDRPTCVLCKHVVTKRDHDRRYFSRYCKDHYHQGRIRCDDELRKAFTIEAKATIPGEIYAAENKRKSFR